MADDKKTAWETYKETRNLGEDASDEVVTSTILSELHAKDEMLASLNAKVEQLETLLEEKTVSKESSEKQDIKASDSDGEDGDIPAPVIPGALGLIQSLKDEVNMMKEQMAAKEKAAEEAKLIQKLDNAIAQRKVLPKEEKMYRTLAKTDPALFEQFLNRAPIYNSLSSVQSTAVGLNGNSLDIENLTQSQVEVANSLGLTPKQFSEQLANERIARSFGGGQ